MRATIILPLILFTASTGWAQAPATAPAPQAAPSSGAPVATRDQKIERITVEDDGARIDETRYGGQTQNITVQPANGMPAYEVKPSSGLRSPSLDDRNTPAGSAGKPAWKVLDF
ncbi:hypothetical protein [Variovorax sp. HJSM1_2]|uniref:hypothetical protein n=1 Tax=Variovorax sp. HJSM1_2 TaxID=3366263 RepID=UPI003BBC9FBC